MPSALNRRLAPAAAGLLLLAGCQSTAPTQADAPVPGGTWDAVLPAPAAVAAGADFPGAEYQRNDARLAAVGDPYPFNQWPAEPTPTAAYWRTLSLPSSSNSTLLFRQRYAEYNTSSGAYYGAGRTRIAP
jgi:hypothetical protein